MQRQRANIKTSKETKKKEGKRKTQASIMDLLEVKDPQIRGTARVFKLRRNVTYRHLREEPIKIRVVVSEVRREFNFHNERPIYLTTDRLPLIRSEIGLWPPFFLSLSFSSPSLSPRSFRRSPNFSLPVLSCTAIY